MSSKNSPKISLNVDDFLTLSVWPDAAAPLTDEDFPRDSAEVMASVEVAWVYLSSVVKELDTKLGMATLVLFG